MSTTRDVKRATVDLEHLLVEWDGRYDATQGLIGRQSYDTGYCSALPPNSMVHPTCEALEYALLLVQHGGADRLDRAQRIIVRILDLQQTDLCGAMYGIWPWYVEEPLERMATPDWNWADFCGGLLAQMLATDGAGLSDSVRDRMRAALGHAAWSIFRRNVGPDYTTSL